jgi:hypothetical protein
MACSLKASLDGKNGVEDVIPDFGYRTNQIPSSLWWSVLTGNTKAEIKVLVVMSEVILLHLLHVLREFRVVQCVVHAVV